MPNKKPAKKKKNFDRYPVLERIGGVAIREVNYISVKLDKREMKQLVKLSVANPGLSIAKLLAFSGSPCDACKNKKVMVAFNGNVVLVRRGILSTKRECRGGSIANKKRKS